MRNSCLGQRGDNVDEFAAEKVGILVVVATGYRLVRGQGQAVASAGHPPDPFRPTTQTRSSDGMLYPAYILVFGPRRDPRLALYLNAISR